MTKNEKAKPRPASKDPEAEGVRNILRGRGYSEEQLAKLAKKPAPGSGK